MYCDMDEQQNHYAQLKKKKARYNRQYVISKRILIYFHSINNKVIDRKIIYKP